MKSTKTRINFLKETLKNYPNLKSNQKNLLIINLKIAENDLKQLNLKILKVIVYSLIVIITSMLFYFNYIVL